MDENSQERLTSYLNRVISGEQMGLVLGHFETLRRNLEPQRSFTSYPKQKEG